MWQDTEFELCIDFDLKDYPQKPPRIKFMSNIFHPNVCSNHSNRQVCMNMLHGHWSAAYDLMTVMTAIQKLLNHPEIVSAINKEAT